MWSPSDSLVLSCCFVFLINAENLEKISIPAVFDSRCFAASLGYLQKRMVVLKRKFHGKLGIKNHRSSLNVTLSLKINQSRYQ